MSADYDQQFADHHQQFADHHQKLMTYMHVRNWPLSLTLNILVNSLSNAKITDSKLSLHFQFDEELPELFKVWFRA